MYDYYYMSMHMKAQELLTFVEVLAHSVSMYVVAALRRWCVFAFVYREGDGCRPHRQRLLPQGARGLCFE
jgi:hypothetical protein